MSADTLRPLPFGDDGTLANLCDAARYYASPAAGDVHMVRRMMVEFGTNARGRVELAAHAALLGDTKRECSLCGADILGNDPHAPWCPRIDDGTFWTVDINDDEEGA